MVEVCERIWSSCSVLNSQFPVHNIFWSGSQHAFIVKTFLGRVILPAAMSEWNVYMQRSLERGKTGNLCGKCSQGNLISMRKLACSFSWSDIFFFVGYHIPEGTQLSPEDSGSIEGGHTSRKICNPARPKERGNAELVNFFEWVYTEVRISFEWCTF